MSAAQREEELAFRKTIRKLSVRTFPGNRDGFDGELQSLAKVDQRVRSNLDEFFTASLGSSMAKNRFDEVKPNEQTIVRLHPITEHGDGTYINANYVDAREPMGVPFVYIATQAPMKNTVLDFWRMVYENDSAFIVMLCATKENGKVKSEIYWPVRGEVYDWGLLSVTTISENVRSDSVHRTLLLRTVRGDEREVFHMQYLNWPDQGVPTSSAPLMEMVQTLGKSPRSVESPIVVHCSGGIGRTGVFISLHIALAKFQLEHRDISIPHIVRFLKLCRSGMVQRKDQYLYLYFSVQREMERMILSAQRGVNLLDSRPRENLVKQQVVQRSNIIPTPALPSGPASKSLWSTASLADMFRPAIATGGGRRSASSPAAGNNNNTNKHVDVASDMATMENYLKYQQPHSPEQQQQQPVVQWHGVGPLVTSSSRDSIRSSVRDQSMLLHSNAIPLSSGRSEAFINSTSPEASPHVRPSLRGASSSTHRSFLEDELVRMQLANRLKRTSCSNDRYTMTMSRTSSSRHASQSPQPGPDDRH